MAGDSRIHALEAAAGLLGLLAEPDRFRVTAALALGASTSQTVAAATGLPTPVVMRALARLADGGLAEPGPDGWRLRLDRLKDVARDAAHNEHDATDYGAGDAGEVAVLRAFLRAGRLTQIPAHRGKRLVVLHHVVRVFEPGVRYPEREVNALLRAFHPDHAALRRYLVDEALLTREAGAYWRTGGPTDLDGDGV